MSLRTVNHKTAETDCNDCQRLLVAILYYMLHYNVVYWIYYSNIVTSYCISSNLIVLYIFM